MKKKRKIDKMFRNFHENYKPTPEDEKMIARAFSEFIFPVIPDPLPKEKDEGSKPTSLITTYGYVSKEGNLLEISYTLDVPGKDRAKKRKAIRIVIINLLRVASVLLFAIICFLLFTRKNDLHNDNYALHKGSGNNKDALPAEKNIPIPQPAVSTAGRLITQKKIESTATPKGPATNRDNEVPDPVLLAAAGELTPTADSVKPVEKPPQLAAMAVPRPLRIINNNVYQYPSPPVSEGEERIIDIRRTISISGTQALLGLRPADASVTHKNTELNLNPKL